MEMIPGDIAEIRRDYLQAISSVRQWKTFFLLLTLLCLLGHMAAWSGAYRGVLEPPLSASPEETGVAGEKSAATPDAASVRTSRFTWDLVRAGLPVTEFVGRASALLLAVAMLVAILVAVAGRLPATGFIRGFFLSLIVLAMFLPWERLAPVSTRIPGVFFSLASIENPPESTPGDTMAIVQTFVRFIGYPAVAVLLLLLANIRFNRSFHGAFARAPGNLPMRVV